MCILCVAITALTSSPEVKLEYRPSQKPKNKTHDQGAPEKRSVKPRKQSKTGVVRPKEALISDRPEQAPTGGRPEIEGVRDEDARIDVPPLQVSPTTMQLSGSTASARASAPAEDADIVMGGSGEIALDIIEHAGDMDFDAPSSGDIAVPPEAELPPPGGQPSESRLGSGAVLAHTFSGAHDTPPATELSEAPQISVAPPPNARHVAEMAPLTLTGHQSGGAIVADFDSQGELTHMTQCASDGTSRAWSTCHRQPRATNWGLREPMNLFTPQVLVRVRIASVVSRLTSNTSYECTATTTPRIPNGTRISMRP